MSLYKENSYKENEFFDKRAVILEIVSDNFENEIENITNDEIVFNITADRFLRNMVRAIVGTFIDIGQGKMSINKLHKIIESEDRSQAGASAPAHGLYLKQIEYPKEIFI